MTCTTLPYQNEIELLLSVSSFNNIFTSIGILSEIYNRYFNRKKRRGHKKTIIAISRMLLTAIYYILKKQEVYNPDLYNKAELIPIPREMTPEQAIYTVQRQGYHKKIDTTQLSNITSSHIFSLITEHVVYASNLSLTPLFKTTFISPTPNTVGEIKVEHL